MKLTKALKTCSEKEDQVSLLSKKYQLLIYFRAKIKVKGVWKNVCAKIIENDNLEELLKKIEVQMQEADIYLKT